MFANLSVDLSYFCNEKCISCKCNTIALNCSKYETLSQMEINKTIEEFFVQGGKSISIYGGEPLTSNLLEQTILYAQSFGLKTRISTNAVLFENYDFCKKISRLNINEIVISIMGTEEAYNMIHGISLYPSFIKGVKNIVNMGSGSHLLLHMTIHSFNIKELHNVISFAHEVGIRHVSTQYFSMIPSHINSLTEQALDTHFIDELNHWNLSERLLITEEQLSILQREIENSISLAKEYGIRIELDPLLLSTKKKDRARVLNGFYPPSKSCLLSDIILSPYGDICMCPMLQHFPIGNIKRQSLAEIIHSNVFDNFMVNIQKKPYLPVCGCCCKRG